MSALPSVPQTRPSADDQPRQRPHLRVVSRPRHTVPYALLLMITAIAGVFGVVALGALAAESAFSTRALESEIVELTLQYEELTAELAVLESPQHVRRVATEELGMVPGQDPAYLLLDGPVPADGTEPAVAVLEEIPEDGELLADPVKPALSSGQG